LASCTAAAAEFFSVFSRSRYTAAFSKSSASIAARIKASMSPIDLSLSA
jgi:hypothetical protein